MHKSIIGLTSLFALWILGGCVTAIETTSPVEIRAANSTERAHWQRTDFHVGGLDTWIAPEPTVVRDDIVHARRSVDDFGHPTVILQFDQAASRKMDELTTRRASRPLAIILDGRVVAAPLVTTPISETLVVNFGKDPEGSTTADKLVNAIGHHAESGGSNRVTAESTDVESD